jgi:hypothetical protein
MTSLQGQTLISFAGGVMKNDKISLSFSLGENAIEARNLQQAIFCQGIQQGFGGIATHLDDNNIHKFAITYQSASYIYYSMPDSDTYQSYLVTISGQQLSEIQLNGQPIEIANLHPGIYFLVVDDNSKRVGAYKILIPAR